MGEGLAVAAADAAGEAERNEGLLAVAAERKMVLQNAVWSNRILKEAEDRMADREWQVKLRRTVTLIWQY